MYRVNVRDVEERRNEIRQKCDRTDRWTRFYDHRTGGDDLPIVSIELGLPLYRMANFRTRTKQRAYIRDNGGAANFFSSGQEDMSAQRVQHEILADFARRGSGESIKPIYEALLEDPRQTEPLLITREGVVVNGNRRLAAMRELFYSDAGRYASFDLLEAMVLPEDITLADLRKIEVRLQMRPETRLPYDWMDEALAVREMRDGGMTEGEIRALMNQPSDAEVRAIIERLNEAEIYLDDYLKDSENYDAIREQQQQFKELNAALQKKSSEPEKDIARRICHVLTFHSRDLGDRAYAFMQAYGEKTREAASRIAERLGVELAPLSEATDEDDLFGSEDVSEDALDYAPLSEALSNRESSQEYAKVISEVCVELREEGKEADAGKRALASVKKANNALSSVDSEAASTDTHGEIIGLLEQIEIRASELLNTFRDLEAPDA